MPGPRDTSLEGQPDVVCSLGHDGDFCNPTSPQLCVYMCAYLSKGSGNLLCSFNLILPVILQASPIYFLDRKDKTQKRQWTGQVTQQVRTEPRLGPTAASLAAQCVSLFPALPSPILPPKGLGQQGN